MSGLSHVHHQASEKQDETKHKQQKKNETKDEATQANKEHDAVSWGSSTRRK
jgi:hypothetical protein